MIDIRTLSELKGSDSFQVWGAKAINLANFKLSTEVDGLAFHMDQLFALICRDKGLDDIFVEIDRTQLTDQNIIYWSKAIIDRIQALPPMLEELKKVCQYFEGHSKVIVRSNCSVEDGAFGASFAGVFESKIAEPLTEGNLWQAMLHVLCSTYSVTALQAMYEHAIPVQSLRPGLLVQSYVSVERGGVLQSRGGDLLSDFSPIIEESAAGPEAVVAGSTTNSGELSPKIVERLSKVARKIEQEVRSPIEIEWGMRKNELHLFQVRPVNREFRNISLLQEGSIYDRSLAKERFPNRLSPLGWSVLQDSLNANVEHFKEELGVEIDGPSAFSLYVDGWVLTNKRPVRFSLVQIYKILRKGRPLAASLAFIKTAVSSCLRAEFRQALPLAQYNFFRQFLRDQIDEAIGSWMDAKRIFRIRMNRIRQDDMTQPLILFDVLKETAESFLSRDIFVFMVRETLAKLVENIWINEGLSLDELNRWLIFSEENPFSQQSHRALDEIHEGESYHLFPSWEVMDEPKTFKVNERAIQQPIEIPAFPGSDELKKAFDLLLKISNIDDGMNFGSHQLLFATRKVLRRVAETMSSLGHLDAWEDIYFLTVHELRGYLKDPRNFRGLVAKRRAAWRASANKDEPVFVGQSSDLATDGSLVASGGELSGRGNFMGSVKGEVYRLDDLSQIESVPDDVILVTKTPHPLLAIKYASIRGLITETGTALSHGVVLASEYSLPVVSAVPGAMSRLKDGWTMTLNSDLGEVHLEEEL